MDYESRAIAANDIPDDDRPATVVISDLVAERDDLRDLVRSLQTELEQAHRAIRELEREHVDARARSFEWNNNVRADGAYQE